MSILDSAVLLTVDITEVVNSLAGAESWQRAHTAPRGYASMVHLVASRGIEEVLGIIVKLIAAITISFLDYTWGVGHALIHFSD